MKTPNLIDMEKLLALKFQKKQRVFAGILAEEARLRGQIDKLDAQARDTDRTTTHQVRAIGADVIWKAWVEKTKTSLNRDLAQVLAQKASMKSTVDKEYGKLLVGRELLHLQQKADQTGFRRRMLENAIETHFQNKPSRRD